MNENDTTQYVIEDDERERLKDTLNSIQPPIVIRIGARDADIVWQELDTRLGIRLSHMQNALHSITKWASPS